MYVYKKKTIFLLRTTFPKSLFPLLKKLRRFKFFLDEENEETSTLKYKLYSVLGYTELSNKAKYVSYARHGGVWFFFSDAFFREVEFEEVRRAKAVVLFYERVGMGN